MLDERQIGLHAGGVAVHHESDRAGGSEHGSLAVPVAVFLTERDGLVPDLLGPREHFGRNPCRIDLERRLPMHAHHLEEGRFVLRVAPERSRDLGDAGRLTVGPSGHQ